MFDNRSRGIAENAERVMDWKAIGAWIVEAAELAAAKQLQTNAQQLASLDRNQETDQGFEGN